MNILSSTCIVVTACLAASAAEAATLKISDATVAGGRLVISGKTNVGGRTIVLDGQFETTADSSGAFAFRLTDYLPPSCVVTLKVGDATKTAVVANCGPRGVTPRGAWRRQDSYAADDLVTFKGSTWRALAESKGQQPGADEAVWEQFVAKGKAGDAGPTGETGATGALGPAGPQGVAGPAGPAGPQGVKGDPGVLVSNTTSSSTFVSVPNGQCSRFAVPVTGAQPGDLVVASVMNNAMPNGTVLMGLGVFNPDELAIGAFCNFSGVTVSTNSLPIRVSVFR